MIEFVNYPPQEQGDIKLAVEAKRALKQHIRDGEAAVRSSWDPEDRVREKAAYSNGLYYMGQAVGHVIVGAMDSPDKELAIKMTKPLDDDYRENVVVDPRKHTAFINGIHKGINVAINCIELGTGVEV